MAVLPLKNGMFDDNALEVVFGRGGVLLTAGYKNKAASDAAASAFANVAGSYTDYRVAAEDRVLDKAEAEVKRARAELDLAKLKQELEALRASQP